MMVAEVAVSASRPMHREPFAMLSDTNKKPRRVDSLRGFFRGRCLVGPCGSSILKQCFDFEAKTFDHEEPESSGSD